MGPAAAPSTFSVYPSTEKSFSDRVAQLAARIDFRRADTDEEREAIFRLRYKAYLREGAILANSSGRFTDDDDEADNAYLMGLYVDGELATSLRLHIASKEGNGHCPSLHVFRDILQPLLDASKVLIDVTRFVADERLSRLHRGLPYVACRLPVLASEYFAADLILAAVRVEHQAFYQRAFRHRLVCEPRAYPQLIKPISLMTLDFPSSAEWLYRRYPFFHSSQFERRQLFDRRQRPAPHSSRDSADSTQPSCSREPDNFFLEFRKALAAG
jgi:N-acyl-L-homoserine lactone synthetase